MSKTSKQRTSGSLHSFALHFGMWFAILCWGAAYVAARFLLHPETAGLVALSPLLLAAMRFGMAGLVFAIPLVRAIVQHRVSARTLLHLAALGQLTFTLYYWLQYIGIEQTTAGIAAILGVGLIPLFTALLAPIFNHERLTFPLIASFGLGFCGVGLIVLQQPLHVSFQPGFLLGALCLIANTFFFALYTNISKQWLRELSPLLVTSATMVSGALGLVLLSLLDPLSHWNEVAKLVPVQWGALLFLALACSVLAYFAYNFALRHLAASRVAAYFYVEPIVSLLLGGTLLGEQLTWQTILGAAAIGSAMLAVHRITQ